MEKIEELDRVIDALRKIGEKAEKIKINLPEILKRVRNPDGSDEEIIQKLLDLRDKITFTLNPLSQLREMAIRERIRIEKKSPRAK